MGIAGFFVLCLPSVRTFPSFMFHICQLLALHTVYIRVCCVVPGLLEHGFQNQMRPRKGKLTDGMTKGTTIVTERDSARVICCRQAFGKCFHTTPPPHRIPFITFSHPFHHLPASFQLSFSHPSPLLHLLSEHSPLFLHPSIFFDHPTLSHPLLYMQRPRAAFYLLCVQAMHAIVEFVQTNGIQFNFAIIPSPRVKQSAASTYMPSRDNIWYNEP